jgi:hypothetical protein
MSEESKMSSPHYGTYPFDPEARPVVKMPEAQAVPMSGDGIAIMLENPSTAISVGQENPVLGRREVEKRKWDTLILNQGTRDEIKMQGRYYTIASDRLKKLDIWTSPPETRDAKRLGSIKGYRVFVLRDSENSEDPLRKGWAEVVVLEITPKGEKPKIKKFTYGERDFVLCRAWISDIRGSNK